ncbi:hypothetical protein MHK_004980 [Candidatus Magnetomorum sp. HK-1]|nr:hypothetical protein MHK_004980 [Candidatus Magnetomorum sp. HK-1]
MNLNKNETIPVNTVFQLRINPIITRVIKKKQFDAKLIKIPDLIEKYVNLTESSIDELISMTDNELLKKINAFLMSELSSKKQKIKKRNNFDVRHKETLRLFLKEYFELFFPELAEKMHFETAKFLDKELIALFEDHAEKDVNTLTDALILIEITINNKREWILIHWEAQGDKEEIFDERMFHYFCGLYYKYRKLVFPIAMFTDPVKWIKPVSDTFNLSLFDYPICTYSYNLIKLKKFSADEFEKQIETNPLAAAYLPMTDYPIYDRPLIKAKAINGINSHFKSGPKQATLFTLIDQSLNLDKNEQLIFEEIINTHNEYKEVKMLQSIEEVGYEKGIEQGEDKVLKGLLKAGLLTKDLDKIVQTTGIDTERVKKIIQELNLNHEVEFVTK